MLDLANPQSWSVLLVDDEPDNLDVVAESLAFFGAKVRTAEDGVKGLVVLRDFTPDLILLDLSMPNMDGWQMRRQIKANPQTSVIPVVALSAHAMAGDKERALEAGFDGYLTKPVSLMTLIKDICATLHETGWAAKTSERTDA